MIRDFIKTWFPPLAAMGRKIRRLMIRRQLDMQRKKHGVISRDRLVSDLCSIGVKKGDVLMVHSSLSKMGFVENGAVTVVDACLEAIGPEGTLVMPAFAHNTFSKIYLDTDPVFDVKHDPSRAGAVTEELRTRPGSLRSFHPTDAVTATGPLASYIVKDHFGQLTPYNTFSPYYRLAEKHACILNIGVPLSTSCTNLHTLEDAVDFKYPIYHNKIYEVKMRDDHGTIKTMKTKVHDPEYSRKRRANELEPLFEREGILRRGMIGEAPATFINDAWTLLEVMIRLYREKGITMYTPHGEDLPV